MKKVHLQIIDELREVAEKLADEQIDAFIQALSESTRIFITGEGRSGLMGKAFAMRLMHAGYNVFVRGETITPSIQSGDALVVISASGNSASMLSTAEQAKKTGAKILFVTTNNPSSLMKVADVVINIAAATKYRLPGEPSTIQPMGNQFDQSVHLLLDAIVISMTQNRENINEYMKQQHANLE